MDGLSYSLRQLCQRNRDGSHATQADRIRILTLMARQLREAGILPADNAQLGVPERRYVTNISKTRELGHERPQITAVYLGC